MMPKKNTLGVSDEPVARPLKKKDFKKVASATFVSESDDSSSEISYNEPKKNWDPFCWKCHQMSYGEVRCSKCVLSFHAGCMADLGRDRDDWLCPECKATTQYAQRSSMDNELVKCLVERVFYDHSKVEFDAMDGFDDSLLVNPVNYRNIIEKSKQNEYATTEAVLLDFEWFAHNCTILCHRKQGSVQNKKTAEIMLTRCKEAKLESDKCADCFINQHQQVASDAFKMVCSKPHLLIWAQYDAFPYWPAKIMESKNKHGPKPLLVHFFGDYTETNISYKNAFLYSKEDPNVWCRDRASQAFSKAVREAQEHINNIEKKFGPFHFAPFKTPVEPDNMAKDLEMMIPGFGNPDLRPNYASADSNHGNVVDDVFDMPSLDSGSDMLDLDTSKEVGNVNSSGSSSATNNSPPSSFLEVNRTPNRNAKMSPAMMNGLQASREYIKFLENELLEKDKVLEQRNSLIRKHRQEIIERDQKMKEAKSKQWCKECLNPIEVEHEPICVKCSLFD